MSVFTDRAARRPYRGRLVGVAFVVLSVAWVLTPFSASAQEGASQECGQIRVAQFSWPAAQIASESLARVLELAFGCAVDRIEASPAAALAAMRAADDIAAPGVRRAQAQAAPGVLAGAQLYGGEERAGWYAPSWLAATDTRARSLAGAVGAPELFQTRAGAKPRLVLCPPNWPCYAQNLNLVDAFGLEAQFDVRAPKSGADLAASIAQAAQSRAPWIGYAWEPSELTAVYALAWLDPGGLKTCAPGAESCVDAFALDPQVLAFAQNLMARLDRDAPAAAAFLRGFHIPMAAMQEALAWRRANNATAKMAAARLVADNAQIWRDLAPLEALTRLSASPPPTAPKQPPEPSVFSPIEPNR